MLVSHFRLCWVVINIVKLAVTFEQRWANICLKIFILNYYSRILFLFCCRCRSLETKAYNHITATYYLLAERMLRKRADALQASAGPAADKEDAKPVLSPLALSPRSAALCCTPFSDITVGFVDSCCCTFALVCCHFWNFFFRNNNVLCRWLSAVTLLVCNLYWLQGSLSAL